MHEHGWAVSPLSAAVPGTYCLSCASALQMLDWFVRCVECGATVEDEKLAEQNGWRFYPDELGSAPGPLRPVHGGSAPVRRPLAPGSSFDDALAGTGQEKLAGRLPDGKSFGVPRQPFCPRTGLARFDAAAPFHAR